MMPNYKKIPIAEDKVMVDILNSETSAISLFVPLRKIEEDVFPIPEDFLDDLSRQAQFFQEKGMSYIFATDSQSYSAVQYKTMVGILQDINVQVLDISTLPNYLPFDKSFSRSEAKDDAKTLFSPHSASPEAEYIDITKIMLADLAGQTRDGAVWNNVLVTDFDIHINDSLSVAKDNKLAFTYTYRHQNPSTYFDTENSMIFVSKDRSKNPDNSDVVTQALQSTLLKLTNKDEDSYGKYGCLAFSSISHDSIVAQHYQNAKIVCRKHLERWINNLNRLDRWDKEEALEDVEFNFELIPDDIFKNLAHPSFYRAHVTNFGKVPVNEERLRSFLVQESTSSGDFLLHGDYYSPNTESWGRPDGLKYCKMEEAISVLSHNDTLKNIETSDSEEDKKLPPLKMGG